VPVASSENSDAPHAHPTVEKLGSTEARARWKTGRSGEIGCERTRTCVRRGWTQSLLVHIKIRAILTVFVGQRGWLWFGSGSRDLIAVLEFAQADIEGGPMVTDANEHPLPS